MKKLLISLLSLFVLSVYGKVNVSLEPKELLVGERGSIQIVSDEGGVQIESVPDVEGVSWFQPSQSSSVSIINNRRTSTSTLSIPFSCSEEGTYIIPPFSFKVNGSSKRSPQFRVKVEKPQAIGKKLFVKTYYNGVEKVPDVIFAGEQVQLAIQVYAAASVHHEAMLPELKMADVQFRDYSKHNSRYTNVAYTGKPESRLIKGNRFHIFTFVSEFTPLKAGSVTGDVKLNWQIVSENSRRVRDFFGRVRVQPTNYPLDFKLPQIKVLPLPPTTDKNGTFLGLIGNWSCKLKLNRSDVAAGEAVNLIMDVKGQGNIDQLNAPELDFEGFRFYKPEVKKQKDGSAQVSWVIVPLSEKSVLPELKFSVFDTRSKSYRVFDYQPVLKVTPGSPISTSILVQGPEGAVEPGLKDKLAAVDILFLKSEGMGEVSIPLEHNVLWLIIPVVGAPLLFVAMLLLSRHRSRLNANSDYRRHHEAVKGKKAVFASVKKVSDEDLPDVVLNDVVPWLNDVMEVPKGTSVQELAGMLEDKELSDMILNAESCKYMTGATAGMVNRSQLLKKIGKLACFLMMFVGCGEVFATGDYPDAVKAYENGDYRLAETVFKHHLDEMKHNGTVDASLLYNLGNCSASLEKYGEALAWYEQARRLAPRDSYILENLNFVRKKLGLEELYASAGPIEVIQRVVEKLRPDQWLFLAALFWVMMFVSLGFNRIKHRGFPVGLVMSMSLAVLCIWAYFFVKTSLYVPHSQAIIVKDASVYKLPVVNEDRVSFSVEPGKYAQVIEEREVFCLVRIDQAEGWIEKKSLKFVWE